MALKLTSLVYIIEITRRVLLNDILRVDVVTGLKDRETEGVIGH